MKACGFRPTVLLETDGMSEKSMVFWSRLVVFSLSRDLVYTVPIGSM